MQRPLWEPSSQDLTQSHMAHFIEWVNHTQALNIKDYFSLHQWSITHLSEFWNAVQSYCKINFSKLASRIFTPGKNMRDSRWFEGAYLNFAENLLKRRDHHPAIQFISENGWHKQLSYAELFQKVTQLAHYLKSLGLKTGDRVAGYLSNTPETIVAMLATASLGCVWSSCSADFGLPALIDRFGQIEPKILFAVDAHFYHGKKFEHIDTIKQLQQQLPQIMQTIIISQGETNFDFQSWHKTILYDDIFKITAANPSFEFVSLPFDHPLYILYSSGTTGKPKCMVHGAGGTLIQHLKELILHTDLHPQDKIFFYTTCGWMMWNWLVSSLAVGATVVLYEGSPLYPKPKRLFDLIDELGITIFGVGAKLIESAAKTEVEPKKTHSLKTLKTILTTGSPLLPESFDYVYQKIKKNVRLSSISGGSDIISCFALGNPLLPVYRGELQCIGLGMDVRIFDEKGHQLHETKGELVCAAPFPSMPIYFWNDPTGEKYQKAYFEKYPAVWGHGDYAMITHHQGMIIYGRSDATLNPKGVRIGTAEIYSQIEKIAEIADSLAVGQEWQGSERIILFIQLKNGNTLTPELIKKIKQTIRENTSSHHVPQKIIAVPDLPKTISGKLVELAVKKMIHGEPVKNLEALANPESLKYFKNITELNK